MRSNVDFPEPEGPIMLSTSPSLQDREIPFRISSPENAFRIFFISKIAMPLSYRLLLLIIGHLLFHLFHNKGYHKIENVV